MADVNQNPDSLNDEDFVPEDDAIIGRAFRWSLVVFVFIGAVIGGTIWSLKRSAPVEAPREVKAIAAQRVIQAPQAPEVKFTDITDAADIDFVRENGATGDRLLPETMGGGCAFFDYDRDGDQDILLINGTHWPETVEKSEPGSLPVATHGLYRNNGRGEFSNVTAGSGLDVPMMGMGAAVGDYDNDGDPDVFITCVGRNHLFRNDDGVFIDVTAASGVGGDPAGWSVAAGFFDSDNDGDLDLFVSHYIQWSREIDFAVDYRLTGIGRAYGAPTNFEGAHSFLYINEGNGVFRDVSADAGLHISNPATGVPMGKALGLCFVDLDSDGLLDVIVANDTVQNFVFHNRGQNRFAEIGAESGLAFDAMGISTGAMGIDAADVRNDNRLAIAIGNFANEMTSFYLAGDSPLNFTDMAVAEGVGGPSRTALKFGLFFLDFELDGRVDLFQCNGHLEEEINKVQPSQHYEQPAQLFWNAGLDARACFSEIPREKLGDLGSPIVGRGAAYADIDADGDLDILLTQPRGRPMLLRNDQTTGNHWLRLKLEGVRCNRDAIGALVVLKTGGVTQRRLVMPTRSYASQVELPVSFGLGAHDHVDEVEIHWPGGAKDVLVPKGVDRVMTIREGEAGE